MLTRQQNDSSNALSLSRMSACLHRVVYTYQLVAPSAFAFCLASFLPTHRIVDRMAAFPKEKMNKHFQGAMSGINYEFPLRCGSCFRLLKPDAGIVAERYSLDVLPVLLEEASFPSKLKCPYENSHVKYIDTILALSKHKSTSQTLPSRLPALKVLDICQHESKICSNALCCNKSYNAVSLESSAKGYSWGINFDLGKEHLDIAETEDSAHKSALQNDGGLCKVLLRKSSLQKGSKVLQFFLNHSTALLNCSSKDETADDLGLRTSSYRLRRCNRAVLYDPWKIVLLFSILSSLGTIVLIFLTLRIKQISDGHAKDEEAGSNLSLQRHFRFLYRIYKQLAICILHAPNSYIKLLFDGTVEVLVAENRE